MVRFIGGSLDHLIVHILISVQHVSHSPTPATPAQEGHEVANADILQELISLRDAKIAELEKGASFLRELIQSKESQVCACRALHSGLP